jgi:hypothetical protein
MDARIAVDAGAVLGRWYSPGLAHGLAMKRHGMLSFGLIAYPRRAWPCR